MCCLFIICILTNYVSWYCRRLHKGPFDQYSVDHHVNLFPSLFLFKNFTVEKPMHLVFYQGMVYYKENLKKKKKMDGICSSTASKEPKRGSFSLPSTRRIFSISYLVEFVFNSLSQMVKCFFFFFWRKITENRQIENPYSRNA